MDSRDHIKGLAARFAARARKLGIRLDAIILYGSRAHGTSRRDSDIDFALLSRRRGNGSFLGLGERLSRAKEDVDLRIEPVWFDTRSLDALSPASLLAEIISTGELVYVRREEAKRIPARIARSRRRLLQHWGIERRRRP